MSLTNGNGSNGHGDFRYSEARLAEKSGHARSDLKSLRDQELTREIHWKKERGEIVLNLAGCKRLLKKLRLPQDQIRLSDFEVVFGPRAAAIVLGGPRRMRVSALPMNPYILHARDELGQFYALTVASNSLFSVGLEIEALPDKAREGFWRIVGPLPRWQGDQAYRVHLQKK